MLLSIVCHWQTNTITYFFLFKTFIVLYMNIRICASMPVKVREQLLAISSLLLPLLIEAGFLLFLLCCSVYSRLTGLLASGKFSCPCCFSPHIMLELQMFCTIQPYSFFLSLWEFCINVLLIFTSPLPTLPRSTAVFYQPNPFKTKIKYSWMCGLPIDHGWLTKGCTHRQNGFSISQLFTIAG